MPVPAPVSVAAAFGRKACHSGCIIVPQPVVRRVMRLFLRPNLVLACALLLLCVAALHMGAAPTAQAAPMAERGTLGSIHAIRGPLSEGMAHPDAYPTSPNPYRQNSWQWTLFNATASFLGLPGLSPVDGLRDEGLGFHADGATRRAGGADAEYGRGNYDGQRAGAYARSGVYGGYGAGYGGAFGVQGPWLYDEVMGVRRGPDGRILAPGSEYSASARRGGGYGGGGYGGGYNMFGENFADSLLQRGISAGMGLANTAAESAILGLMGSNSPYGNGKARLNFMWYVNQKGESRFGGEGDVLWPLYDNPYTTIYTQFGARSMYGGGDNYGPDRWIGNIGLGQRWFPGAKLGDDGKVDSGSFMFGYNAFFDYDITRGHQRGGLGLEAQYDWLKVATNWYMPLSDWKDSKDFDGRFVQERAAQGWDVRVKGYLPFYREIALTGAYTQWYGDNVGMFGPSKLEKNPKVWSYGIEYTPIPALTAFVNQRSTERGRNDTEFGLRFTYHFGMDAESQFKPSRVAEMRTVHGSRHDFVDRENKIILEYKAKNRFYIESLGMQNGAFVFRIRNGFKNYVDGQIVHVTASGSYLAEAAPAQPTTFFARALDTLDKLLSVAVAHAASLSKSYTSAGGGYVRVPLAAGYPPGTTLTIQAGDTSLTVPVQGGTSNYDITYVSGHQATLAQGASMTLVYKVTLQGTSTPAPNGTEVKLLAQTQGGTSTTPEKLEVASGTVAGGSGQVSLGFNGSSGTTQDNKSFLARKVKLYATAGGSESFASNEITVGTLPSGTFITSVSGQGMIWSNAEAFCAAHGGKLPTTGRGSTDSYLYSPGDDGVAVGDFGTVGANTSSIPTGYWYWSRDPGSGGLWGVNVSSGNVTTVNVIAVGTLYAACVQ